VQEPRFQGGAVPVAICLQIWFSRQAKPTAQQNEFSVVKSQA